MLDTRRGEHELIEKPAPIVGRQTGSLMSTYKTFEYLQYAHIIQSSPSIFKCPQDDPNPLYAQNINDRIRTIVCRKRKSVL